MLDNLKTPKIPAHLSLPKPIDDVSLAFSLGIQNKTMWWLVHINDYTLIQTGTGAYTLFDIPKKSGGKRTIHAPHPRLKEVQKAILVTYLEPFPVPEHVGAFVKGRGLNHTSEQHVGAKYQITLDLKDFFTTTRRQWVRDVLYKVGYNRDVVRPLASLMTVPIALKNGHKVGVVPQGGPTSGMIANLVAMDRLDTPIHNFLETSVGTDNFVYTRYADDLVVSFFVDLDDARIKQITDDLFDIITTSGYAVNFKKVRHTKEGAPMKVLGHTVNVKVNVPQEVYRRLRAIAHNCATHGLETQYQRYGASDVAQLINKLRGEITYWSSVNPERMSDIVVDFQHALENRCSTTP